MRIALAQLDPTSGDIDGNTQKVLDAITEATARGAELLVTPEMCIPGYCIGDLVEDAGFLAANERAIQRVAAAATGLTAVVGFIDHDRSATNDNGTILKYNAAATVSGGRILQRAHKSLLPNYRYFDDKRYFAPGQSRDVVDVDLGSQRTRLGVSICEDMWDEFYAVKPLPELAAKGADVLVNINASPFYPGKREQRDAIIRQHIARLRKPFVYVNTSGAADNGKNIIPFDGESLVYNKDGRLLAVGRQFAEELLIVDTDVTPAEPVQLPGADREREIYDALVMALRDYMRKTGFSQAVVAVSGGIDSALVLAIAADALGAERVSAFNMPSQFNTGDDARYRHGAGEESRRALRHHPNPGHCRRVTRGLFVARAPDRARVHARESAGAHQGHPDDGRIERYGGTADFMRQRDRDRARLRDALWRHVRRHLAHR